MAGVAVLLAAAFIVRRVTAPRASRIGCSIQLTFTGQLAAPTSPEDVFPALATDNGRIYFSQIAGGRWALAQTSVAGGEVVSIETPFKNALLLHVSPDGSKLLVRDFDIAETEGPLWMVPLPGQALRRLSDVVAHDAPERRGVLQLDLYSSAAQSSTGRVAVRVRPRLRPCADVVRVAIQR